MLIVFICESNETGNGRLVVPKGDMYDDESEGRDQVRFKYESINSKKANCEDSVPYR